MINVAGLYPDLPIDEYHSDCCDGVSISSSGLKRILDCPARYWAESYYNPARVVKTTKALDFGKAAHALVLGEPEFAAHFIISPFDAFTTKEARSWRDEQTKTIVKAADMDAIHAMARRMRETPATARAFTEGKPEQSFIWRDRETGVWLKSRPDWVPEDLATNWSQEYKSAVSIHPRKLSAQAFQLCYDVQAAMTFDGIVAVTGSPPLGIAHVCQEKAEPYLCDLRIFTPDQIDLGRVRYRKALRIFAQCWERHLAGAPEPVAWPAYSEAGTFFSTPAWVTMDLEDEDYGTDSSDDDEPEYAAVG